MRKTFFLVLLALSNIMAVHAQNNLRNFGDLKIHTGGRVGFHTNLINDGTFNENLGLTGFYQDDDLSISGAFPPVFYDFEVGVEGHLYLETEISIANSLNFIFGDIRTPRDNKTIFVKILQEAIYNGEMDISKIDGYTAIEGQNEFVFPVGHDNILRPLRLNFVNTTSFADCAYFFENPDNPVSFSVGFDTGSKDITLANVCTHEFWNLNTSGAINISLTWNLDSELYAVADQAENIVVVGWNKNTEQWENLGSSFVEGNLNDGIVTSKTFDAELYEIFTLGNLFDLESNEPGNYLLTPNGDGNNDTLILEITDQSPNNELKIFSRWGQLVFEETNYTDEFRGVANRSIVGQDNSLPGGLYYYVIELKDLDITRQGFFYIAQ